jgi:hypothetical protein
MIPPLVGMDELRLAGVGAWLEFELLTLGVHKYLHQGHRSSGAKAWQGREGEGPTADEVPR